MGYTNSSLVAYTKLSPNHSGQRTHKIDRISPHCVVGQCSAEGLGDWFYKSSTQASSNYGIDKSGRVGMYVEDSIADHSAYLLGTKNGSKLRYEGLKGCTDYKKAAQIIKNGGYATSLTYVDKLCSIIERWKLTQYDVAGAASDVVECLPLWKSEREKALIQYGADLRAVLDGFRWIWWK